MPSMIINRNRFNKITRINNERVVSRLNNEIFITEKILNDYFISYNVYDLKKNKLLAGFQNVIEGLYDFTYDHAKQYAKEFTYA